MPFDRQIEGEGTSEAVWSRWLRTLSVVTLETAQIVSPARRLVVVAPHPDDEVLGCGGLIALHARAGGPVVVIGCTDGEASHLGLPGHEPDYLAQVRAKERLAGLSQLGLNDPQMVRLRYPDGKLQENISQMAFRIESFLRPGDVLVTTWQYDGHPDHEACAEACLRAADRAGCSLWQVPVWMWHWARPCDARIPWERFRLLRISAREVTDKSAALRCHESQLTQRAPGTAAVITPAMMARMSWRYECFIGPAT